MTVESLGKAPATTETPWVPTDDDFGARLALIRWRMGWNVKEAALACGIPAASWRLWEIEKAQPRRLVEVATLIARRTGCDFGWLLAGSRLRRDATVRYAERPIDTRPAGHPAITRSVRLSDRPAA